MKDKKLTDRFKREDRQDMLPAVIMSGAVHALLFVGLFSVFQWSTTSEVVYAELWAPEDISAGNDLTGVAEKKPDATPPRPHEAEDRREEQEALEREAREMEALVQKQAEVQRLQAENERIKAEKLAEEARREEDARRKEDVRRAREKAEAERIEKARQEAIEAERRAEEERLKKEAERLAQEKLAEERRIAEEERKALEARRAEEKRIAEEMRIAEEKRIAEQKRIAAKKKAEADRLERERIRRLMRQQELARLNAKVDPDGARSGNTRGDKRNTRQNLTGVALAQYNDRVIACVRQNISIDVPPSTQRNQFRAEYQVRLLPTGEQIGSPQKRKASGWDAYDRAVEIAIRKCNPFPKPDIGYNPPRELLLMFDPVDDRH